MMPAGTRFFIRIYNWQVAILAWIVALAVLAPILTVLTSLNEHTVEFSAQIAFFLGSLVGAAMSIFGGDICYPIFGERYRLHALSFFGASVLVGILYFTHLFTARVSLDIIVAYFSTLVASAIFQKFVNVGKRLPTFVMWKEARYRDLLRRQKLMATDGQELSNEALIFIGRPDVRGYKVYFDNNQGVNGNAAFFKSDAQWLCVYGDQKAIWDRMREQQEIWNPATQELPAAIRESIAQLPDLSAREKLQFIVD